MCLQYITSMRKGVGVEMTEWFEVILEEMIAFPFYEIYFALRKSWT